MTPELLSFVMFGGTILVLILGFPVALTLAGSALLFAFIGAELGMQRPSLFLNLAATRIFTTMKTESLVAVPLFVYMGVVLQRSNIAGDLLESMGKLFGSLKGGLGISVVIVGALLAASTGIVGATVVTMGLMSLPIMLKAGYSPRIASGIICASGTLGQIIPPSIVLVLLANILQGVNEDAAMLRGDLVPEPVTAIDLFAGALLPGLLLVGLYLAWVILQTFIRPKTVPSLQEGTERPAFFPIFKAVLPPLILIVLVLGSILGGIATPTEAAAVGAIGALVLAAISGRFNWLMFRDVGLETVKISSMVFMIIIGAGLFSTVFKGFGGDAVIAEFLRHLPGGAFSALLLVMILMFVLGFFLDFIEIIYVVVPIVGPILIALGYDPLWLGVMVAINLQTSFLTPPFGFALFYLRGVAPPDFQTRDLYRGVMPFIGIQIIALALIWMFPAIVTWLPNLLFR